MIRRFMPRTGSTGDKVVLVTDIAGNTREVKSAGDAEVGALVPPDVLEEIRQLEREMTEGSIRQYESYRHTHIAEENDR
jgi:hypothetical protein